MPDSVTRFVELVTELWNSPNPELAAQIYSDRVQRIDPNTPEPTTGMQQLMVFINQVHNGFPDFKIRITQHLRDEDRLVTEWTCSGTHNGEFQGAPPTGKRVNMSGVTISRIENGKIIEERAYYDRFELLQQMGVLPASADTAPEVATTKR